MIAKTNMLIDNPHNVVTVNRVDVEYSSLIIMFIRNDTNTKVTVMYNGYPITINDKGELSRYLPFHSKQDFERLLRNYTEKQNSELIFNDRKFFNKFEKNIVATF